MARIVSVGQEAEGVIAIGQFATGVIAIGQVANGAIAIGQVARGGLAIGMVAFGLFAIGMGSLGVAWSAGMVAVGGRVGSRMLALPLVPYLPRTRSLPWAGISAAQLALLVVATIAFWSFVAVPIGDDLLGADGVLRNLELPPRR